MEPSNHLAASEIQKIVGKWIAILDRYVQGLPTVNPRVLLARVLPG
jgi:hypothetical protein